MRAWDDFLQKLEEDLGAKTVSRWLRTLKIVDFDACNLYLEAADSLHILWFEEHIRKRAITSLRNNNHHSIKVHLTSASDDHAAKKKKNKPRAPLSPAPFPLSFPSDPLDHTATFSTYLISDKTIYPLKYLAHIAEGKQLATFNPLFLFGDSGAGKTHLMQALATSLMEKGYKVHFVNGQTFTDHLVAAIRNGKMEVFRRSYRSIDLLIIDDIHLLARRSASQEEFFHTFNALHSAGKQIILSAPTSPGRLTDIEQRLISRFEWGLTLQVAPLSLEKRAEFIEQRAAFAQFPLSPEVAPFLTQTFPSMPALLMAFDALLLRADEKKISCADLDQTKLLLADIIQSASSAPISPETIIGCVASSFDVTGEDILGKGQTKECATPRKVAMYFCREKLNLSYKEIGRIFQRDHSTVISSVKGIQKKVEALHHETCTSIAEVHSKILQKI